MARGKWRYDSALCLQNTARQIKEEKKTVRKKFKQPF